MQPRRDADVLFDLSERILSQGKELLALAEQSEGRTQQELLRIAQALVEDADRLSYHAQRLGRERTRSF